MKRPLSARLLLTLFVSLALFHAVNTQAQWTDIRDSQRAGQVNFANSFDRFIEGNAPVVKLQLDGNLIYDMYIQVVVWEQSKSASTVAFRQTLTGAPKPNGTYQISRSKLNALSPGKYLMQIKLCRVGAGSVSILDLLSQSFTVQRTPPPPVDTTEPDTTEPDTTPPDTVEPDPTPDSTPDDPEIVFPEDPEETVIPNDPPPSNMAKRVVWNLKPQDGQTYRDLTLRGGVRAVWESVDNVTFIDCDFRDAAVLLTVQARDDGSAASRNWRFVRCTFIGATRDDWGHSHGAFLQGVDNFVFSNCTFKYNGWLNGVRFNQNHNVYLLDVGAVTFSDCTFDRGAAQGIKGLGYHRLEVDGCIFNGNLIDIGSDDRSASGYLIVRNCEFYNTGGVDSIGQTLGWSLALEHYKNDLTSVLIQDCEWFDPSVETNVWAVKLAGSGVRSAQIIGCDFSEWKVNTSVWPKIVNHIGGRLVIKNTTGAN